jgi:serine/threonine protein kinase
VLRLLINPGFLVTTFQSALSRPHFKSSIIVRNSATECCVLRTVSHYEVLEKLGEGGMGVVWKARDTRLGRFVALKVLAAEKMSDPDRKRRFVQEAKSASALNHPNIITIYDIDQAEGADFIAMEFVAGKSLDQLIPRKGLRLNEALKYAIQVADAFASAFRSDVSPSVADCARYRPRCLCADGGRVAYCRRPHYFVRVIEG